MIYEHLSPNQLLFFELYPLLIQYNENKIPKTYDKISKPVKSVYLLSLFYLQLK